MVSNADEEKVRPIHNRERLRQALDAEDSRHGRRRAVRGAQLRADTSAHPHEVSDDHVQRTAQGQTDQDDGKAIAGDRVHDAERRPDAATAGAPEKRQEKETRASRKKYDDKYTASEKGRARQTRYNSSPKGLERKRRYRLSRKYLERKRAYQQSPKGRETARKQYHAKAKEND